MNETTQPQEINEAFYRDAINNINTILAHPGIPLTFASYAHSIINSNTHPLLPNDYQDTILSKESGARIEDAELAHLELACCYPGEIPSLSVIYLNMRPDIYSNRIYWIMYHELGHGLGFLKEERITPSEESSLKIAPYKTYRSYLEAAVKHASKNENSLDLEDDSLRLLTQGFSSELYLTSSETDVYLFSTLEQKFLEETRANFTAMLLLIIQMGRIYHPHLSPATQIIRGTYLVPFLTENKDFGVPAFLVNYLNMNKSSILAEEEVIYKMHKLFYELLFDDIDRFILFLKNENPILINLLSTSYSILTNAYMAEGKEEGSIFLKFYPPLEDSDIFQPYY